MKILAISGSLKPDSTNGALLRALAALASAGTEVVCYDRQIGELPHFRPDLDEEGMTAPPSVAALRALVRSADAIFVSCPEYAHGVPGSFKNMLDWLVSSGELTDKPTALVMASPSGATYARTALVPTLLVMGCRLVFDESLVLARRHFDETGRLLDDEIASELHRALTLLADAAADTRQGP
jgi:chromate reductase